MAFERRVEGGKGVSEPRRSLEEDGLGGGPAGASLACFRRREACRARGA